MKNNFFVFHIVYLTVMFLGLKWPMQARSTKAWSPEQNINESFHLLNNNHI
jgi:hypothetical protein